MHLENDVTIIFFFHMRAGENCLASIRPIQDKLMI